MATLKIIEKVNNSGEPIKHGDTLVVDSEKLVGVSTKSLYVRKGFKSGTLFLSQRDHGSTGAGDICKIMEDSELEVNASLFDRIRTYAEKANAIIK